MVPKVITNCQIKKSYPSKEAADKVGIYLYIEKGVEVETYRCNICENWHFTRSKK